VSHIRHRQDVYGMIKPTANLLKDDAWLTKSMKAFPDRKFPENSHFLRGCVRVSFKG